jgi:hypothetical protein
MDLYINGKKEKVVSTAGTYTTIERVWKNGDKLEMKFDMALYTKAMPDNASKIAVFYGPLLMAGTLGTTRPDLLGVPVIVTNNKPVDDWIKRVDGAQITFTTNNAGRPKDVLLQPFYTIHDQRYIVYWNQFTEGEWILKKEAYEKELARLADMEKHTTDVIRFGEQQSEKDHGLDGINTGVGTYMDRTFRDALNGGWFSFKLKVKEGRLLLLNTYNGSDDGNRAFEIFADGIKISSEVLKGEKPGEYIEKGYDIPETITKGKDSINIKFQAIPENIAGAFFESRILIH